MTKATKGKHERVPKKIHYAAKTFDKEALEEDSMLMIIGKYNL